jgi:hypothetical protein
MTATNAKVQSIARVLQSEIDPPSRGLDTSGPLKGTWRVVDGKTYYVVLNFSDQPVTRSMTFHGIGNVTTASVHGEGRSVSLANGALTDTFGAYSVHVYEVAGAAAPAAEVAAGTTVRASAVDGSTAGTAVASPSVAPSFATSRIGWSVLEPDEESFDARLGR